MSLFYQVTEFALFIFSVIVLFYLPGKFLFEKLKIKLDLLEKIFLYIVLGFSISTILFYFFSFLNATFLALSVILIIDFITILPFASFSSILKLKAYATPKIRRGFNRDLFPAAIVLILITVFSLNMIQNGPFGDFMIYSRDDLWHLALINELKANFPPDIPGFAGVPLKGYHFFYNFLLAQVSTIFNLSPLSLYYRYFPLLISLLWGGGVYVFMMAWTKSKAASLWAVFLTMFGGSFVYVLHLQGFKSISLDSGFGMMQPISTLSNPPFTISIPILIAFLFAVYKYASTGIRAWLIPIVILVGLVSMFKVYAGIIVISGFLFLVFIEVIRKNFQILIALLVTGVLFFSTYWIFADKNAHLIWFPFWAPHKVLIDNLPWYGYEEKMYTYSRLSVIKGLLETEAYAFFLFFIGNLGSRFFGLILLPLLPRTTTSNGDTRSKVPNTPTRFQARRAVKSWVRDLLFKKEIKKQRPPFSFLAIIFVMTAVSVLVPLLFLQSGKVFEITQMTWYFLFFCSLFAAIGFARLLVVARNLYAKIFITFIIIVLTLPSAYEVYTRHYNSVNLEKLSSPYFQSMKALNNHGNYNDTVLEIPPFEVFPDEKKLTKWYQGSTPGITAFGNKRSYLNSVYIDFPGVDIKPRINFLRKLILFKDVSLSGSDYSSREEEIKKGFKKFNISFIYSPYSMQNLLSIKGVSQVFQNKAATLYKIDIK